MGLRKGVAVYAKVQTDSSVSEAGTNWISQCDCSKVGQSIVIGFEKVNEEMQQICEGLFSPPVRLQGSVPAPTRLAIKAAQPPRIRNPNRYREASGAMSNVG